jgi:hypothetical protein
MRRQTQHMQMTTAQASCQDWTNWSSPVVVLAVHAGRVSVAFGATRKGDIKPAPGGLNEELS